MKSSRQACRTSADRVDHERKHGCVYTMKAPALMRRRAGHRLFRFMSDSLRNRAARPWVPGGLRIKRALAEPMDVDTSVDRATRTGSAFSLALPGTQLHPEESTARTFNYPVTGINGSLAAAATG